MPNTEKWGSLSPKKTPESETVPDVTADIELSMNNFFLNELEHEENTATVEKITVPPLSSTMLYAISLHQHSSIIEQVIGLQKLTKSMEKVDFEIPKFKEVGKSNLNFTKEDFRKEDVEICCLGKTVVREILKKSIATLFAQIGYETCQQSALLVLMDVLEDFFKKICHQTRIAFEDEENKHLGFPHVIERVLVEIGLGGVKSLDNYYQNRVVKYVKVLEDRCQNLSEKYQSLLIPKSPSPVDRVNKVVRVKVEEEEDVIEVENPEVHFSTIDGDVNLSILETGYQLLNSLEAEANLQSMAEGVEDIAVSESPGVVSLSSDDMSHLSPFNKKKRYK